MPYISMFFGIIIRMFHKEHNPPHFHAVYQGQVASFDFAGKMIQGNISSRIAKKLIKQWAFLHKRELEENWRNALQKKPFNKIDPLE